MNVRGRLIAIQLALIVPGLLLGVWMNGAASRASDVSMPALPKQIGVWTQVLEQKLQPEHFKMLQPDAYLARLYEAPGRAPIGIYVGLYGGRAHYGKGAHDPNVCYPAHGWEIVGTKSVNINPPGARSFAATQLTAHLGSETQFVLYWFQPAHRWPLARAAEELARAFDAVRGSPQYAFVRIVALRPAPTTERDLVDFASRIAWPVRKALVQADPS